MRQLGKILFIRCCFCYYYFFFVFFSLLHLLSFKQFQWKFFLIKIVIVCIVCWSSSPFVNFFLLFFSIVNFFLLFIHHRCCLFWGKMKEYSLNDKKKRRDWICVTTTLSYNLAACTHTHTPKKNGSSAKIMISFFCVPLRCSLCVFFLHPLLLRLFFMSFYVYGIMANWPKYKFTTWPVQYVKYFDLHTQQNDNNGNEKLFIFFSVEKKVYHL